MSHPCQKVFVSFSEPDRSWAEWVANMLGRNGYEADGQYWGRHRGVNFVSNIHESLETCDRFIAILSNAYLRSKYAQLEWTSALARDPSGKARFMIPIMIERCKPTGLLSALNYIDLVGLFSDESEHIVLQALKERCYDTPKTLGVDGEKQPYHAYFPNAPKSEMVLKYEELLSREYAVLVSRRVQPTRGSRTSALLFGKGFPFGNKEVIPAISRYSLYLDIRKLLDATAGSYKADQLEDVTTTGPHVLYKAASCRWRSYVCAVADGLLDLRPEILVQPILDGLGQAPGQRSSVNELLAIARQYRDLNIKDDRALSIVQQLLRLIAEVAAREQLTLEDILNEEQANYRKENLVIFAGHQSRATYLATLYFSDVEGTYDVIFRAFANKHINIVTSKSWTLTPGEVAYAELKIECDTHLAICDEIDVLRTKKPYRDLVFDAQVGEVRD